jgi:hypothetical protein
MVKVERLKSQIIKKSIVGEIKPKAQNRTDKISQGHLCLREENLILKIITLFMH